MTPQLNTFFPVLNPAPVASQDVGVVQPILVPFFDDQSSYWHAIMGGLVYRIPAVGPVAVFLYIAYQLAEKEPLPNKIGDFAEFACGWLASEAFVQGVLK